MKVGCYNQHMNRNMLLCFWHLTLYFGIIDTRIYIYLSLINEIIEINVVWKNYLSFTTLTFFFFFFVVFPIYNIINLLILFFNVNHKYGFQKSKAIINVN